MRPVENGVVVPARAAYSHSASVSSLYVRPAVRDNQGRKPFVMSYHDTLDTGRFPTSLALYEQSPAATQAPHSSSVTSNLPTAKGLPMVTLCMGPSSFSCFSSFSGDPLMKLPAGTATLPGHSGQSLKVSPGLTQRFSLPTCASTPSHRSR